MRFIRKRWGSAAWMAAWGIAVGVGVLLTHAHMDTPSNPGAPPRHWPVQSRLERDASRPQLLMFLHPRCPCSRASVTELAAILERCDGRLAAQVVLFQPAGRGDAWSKPEFLATLADIPGLKVTPDPNGEELRRFGVSTSGHVLLFDARGNLKFSGGLTPGRGQLGNEAGRSALLARLLGQSPSGLDEPVFGCSFSNCRSTKESRRP
ncbi:MAG: RedB protein [Isosphaeraceae bacterium]